MSCPTVDQASKQNFVVSKYSEFGKLVVRWRERDINVSSETHRPHHVMVDVTHTLTQKQK